MKSLRPTLVLYALPALLAAAFPRIHGVLLYERGQILGGELWRLWTGHWVHFSPSHLLWNLVVLVLAGSVLEEARPGLLLRYTLLAAPLSSAAFLVIAPAMKTYGGLSGLATGAVTLLALVKLNDGDPNRACWIAVLALVAGKFAVDATRATPLLSSFSGVGIQVSALAHFAGAVLAVVFFLSHRKGSCFPFSGSHPVSLDTPGQLPR